MNTKKLDHELVLGTRNHNKAEELAQLVGPMGINVVSLENFPDALAVIEDGDSFAANATLKASQQSLHLGRWVLADDSGLEVDALGGAPGVFSARFAGSDASDEENNTKLLDQLGETPWEKRTARYVCHISLADMFGVIRAESHDVCHGRIRFEPAGTNGFGYDPLFEIVEYHQTFGQLGPAVKRALSHRSRALRTILHRLAALNGSGAIGEASRP